MDNIIIITIVIFSVGILLCQIREREFDDCKWTIVKRFLGFISKERINEYFVNIVVAFLGVTIAILITDIHTVNENKKETIDYIETVLLEELYLKEAFLTEVMIGLNPSDYIQAIIETENVDGNDKSIEIESKYDVEKLFETIKIYPIVPIMSLDTFLTDSPYEQTISRGSLSALKSCRDSLTLQKIRMENADNIENMQRHLEYLVNDFYHIQKIVQIELEYQKGKISEEDVYNQIDKLYDELRENKDAIVIG